MAISCEITSGITLGCKDVMGGVQYFWLTNFENVATTTLASGVITAITMASGSPAAKFYKYQVNRNTSDFSAPIKSSVENGTTVYEHTMNLQFNKIEAIKSLQVQLVSAARLVAVAVDFNGKAFYLGRVGGLDATGGGMESGKKGEDFAGYKLTLTGAEPALPCEIDTALLISPIFA